MYLGHTHTPASRSAFEVKAIIQRIRHHPAVHSIASAPDELVCTLRPGLRYERMHIHLMKGTKAETLERAERLLDEMMEEAE